MEPTASYPNPLPLRPPEGAPKPAYQAFVSQRQSVLGLELRRFQGTYWEGKGIYYSQLRPFDFVTDQWLLLPCVEFCVTIGGEHLHRLVSPLLKQQVETIQLYRPEFFAEPGPEDTIITEIRIDPRHA